MPTDRQKVDDETVVRAAIVNNTELVLSPEMLSAALADRYYDRATAFHAGRGEYKECIDLALAFKELERLFVGVQFDWDGLDRRAMQEQHGKEGE